MRSFSQPVSEVLCRVLLLFGVCVRAQARVGKPIPVNHLYHGPGTEPKPAVTMPLKHFCPLACRLAGTRGGWRAATADPDE